jgi:hypothetical protein
MKNKSEIIEELWEMYESSILEEYRLDKQLGKNDEYFYFTAIERSTKNGVTNGILRSIEILENNKQKTWKRAFEIYCKVRKKDIDTNFGFWTPLSVASPLKDDTYMVTLDGEICGIDEPIVGMCGYENGKWDEEGYIIAWMPLPKPYKEG